MGTPCRPFSLEFASGCRCESSHPLAKNKTLVQDFPPEEEDQSLFRPRFAWGHRSTGYTFHREIESGGFRIGSGEKLDSFTRA